MKQSMRAAIGTCLVALLLAACGGQATAPVTPSSASSSVSTPASPKPTLTIAPVPTPIPGMSEVHSLLRSSEDLDIVIVSDSTADELSEWPALWGQEMSADHAVTLNRWISSRSEYQPNPISVDGPSRQIWNCAVSGWRPENFYYMIEGCLPADPSFVIISLGHNNNSDPTQAVPQLEVLLGRIRYLTPTEVPIVITLQNPETAPARIANAEAVIEAQREWAQANDYPIIDAYDAFMNAPHTVDVYLKSDGLHPNEAGSQLWAATVIETLTPWRV